MKKISKFILSGIISLGILGGSSSLSLEKCVPKKVYSEFYLLKVGDKVPNLSRFNYNEDKIHCNNYSEIPDLSIKYYEKEEGSYMFTASKITGKKTKNPYAFVIDDGLTLLDNDEDGTINSIEDLTEFNKDIEKMLAKKPKVMNSLCEQRNMDKMIVFNWNHSQYVNFFKK